MASVSFLGAFALALFLSWASVPNSVDGLSAQTVIDSPLLTQKIGTNRTIKVDVNGDGEFRSIQAAIDSIPAGNSQWIIVHVRKGVYREKVHVPKNKSYIFLRGNGKGRTWVVWDASSSDNMESATLRVHARNFIAFGISFKNEAPDLDMAQTAQNQSVAAAVSADKVSFYHCGFYSAHNSLFDNRGKHFYDHCYITGSVDFIFGRGQSIFANCEVFVNSDKRVQIKGSITAQHRESEKEKSGFVFIKGKVYGVGGVYLGRAKGAFSRVIFAQTYISRTIVPEGWTNWSYEGSPDNLYHGEYKTKGPGAAKEAKGKRVKWAKELTEDEVAPFMSIDFIEGTEWLPAWHDDD